MRPRLVAASLAVVAVCALVATAAATGRPAGAFTSSQYGYRLTLPQGWTGVAATTRFGGGDIDHTASYADSLTAPGRRFVFVLGSRTSSTVTAFARAHGAWLAANRPCRGVGRWAGTTLAGEPAQVATFACEGGVYGRTLAVKWVVVRRGLGIVVTQFTPDGRRARDRAALGQLLRGLAWST